MGARDFFLEIDFVKYYYNYGYCIPIVKVNIDRSTYPTRKTRTKIEESDAFSDCISIDEEDQILFIGNGAREYFEDQKEEVEDWLREYFLGDTVYAIFGFMRKRWEAER